MFRPISLIFSSRNFIDKPADKQNERNAYASEEQARRRNYVVVVVVIDHIEYPVADCGRFVQAFRKQQNRTRRREDARAVKNYQRGNGRPDERKNYLYMRTEHGATVEFG